LATGGIFTSDGSADFFPQEANATAVRPAANTHPAVPFMKSPYAATRPLRQGDDLDHPAEEQGAAAG